MLTAISDDLSLRNQFLDAVWGGLRNEPAPLWDIAGEIPSTAHPVSCVLDQGNHAAVLQWPTCHPATPERVTGLALVFCVPTGIAQSRGLRFGVQWRSFGQPTDAQDYSWLSHPVEAFGAWAKAHHLNVTQPSGLPSFVEICLALRAPGMEQLVSATLYEQLLDAQAQVQYFKDLARDRASELLSSMNRVQELEGLLSWGKPEGDSSLRPSEVAKPAQGAFSWSDLPQWCKELEGRLTVLPRALNAAKKALYEQPAHVKAGLEFLAGPYRDCRLGLLSVQEMETALHECGLRIAGSVAPSIAGEQGDAYFVPWGGKKRFLELHLLKGGGRDERYCLRIYFFWDTESQQCVVGWLPSHLNNSLT